MAAIHAASFPRGWSEAEIAALLARPATRAVATGHGFALLQVVPPEAEMLTLAIDPAVRGQGHGTALLAGVLAAARAAGARHLGLEVEEGNAPARALYARAGFAETARRAGYYARPGAPPADALVLGRDLAAQSGGM